MRAGQDADQRRLAGAVAADQGDDLTGVEVDADAVDGVDAAERHADVAHLDERHRPPVARVGHIVTGSLTWSRASFTSTGAGTTSRCRLRRRARCRRTMSWVGESTLSSTMPERSDCMMTAPSTAPGIVPMPPENEVPPITAAEITSSSFSRRGR